MNLYTIGFTQKSAAQFFGALQAAGVQRVVDVRLNNRSQLAGFAKQDDLRWLLGQLNGMDYVHLPELAPTAAMLGEYRSSRDWEAYASAFTALMTARQIEETVPQELLAGGCLLCSEAKPHHCHRRLVAEYLARHWGEVEITHLG